MGGDWGRENEINSHRYRADSGFSGEQLNEHGFLVDIYDLRRRLEAAVAYFDEKVLNELPELGSQNPSLENLCRIFYEKFRTDFKAPNITALTVRIWEDKIAWASLTSEA